MRNLYRAYLGRLLASGFLIAASCCLTETNFLARSCEPKSIQASDLKLPADQKALAKALLTYYDALNSKDFTALKDLLDPSRIVDTSPGPTFSYRNFLNWRRLRIYAAEIINIDTAAGQITVKEDIEAEAYDRAIFFYNSPAVYTFKSDGGKYLMTSRGTSPVDQEKTTILFELLFLARDNLYRGNFAEAEGYLDRFLAADPQDYYGLVMKGAFLLNRGEHRSALALFEKADAIPEKKRDICPKLGRESFDAQLLDSIGVCLLALDKKAEAKKSFEKARDLNPEYVPCLMHLAELDKADGKHPEALGWYQKAYKIYQDIPQAEIALFGNPAYGDNKVGMAYLKENRLEEAEKMFTQATKENFSYDKPYNNLGLVKEKQNLEAEAIGFYRKALDLNQNNVSILLNLANIYKKKGDTKAAGGYLDKIFNLDPENLAAINLKKQ